MNNREELIEYFKSLLSDVIPYNSPDYDKRLNEAAENLADAEIAYDLKQQIEAEN